MTVLARLAAALRDEGGLMAEAVADPAPGEAASLGDLAGARRALAVEAIREGFLLHHGGGRIVRTEDPDLVLLSGDRLYALGLAELAAAGDLDGVRAMAELIARSSAAAAAGDRDGAEALWEPAVRELTRSAGVGDR